MLVSNPPPSDLQKYPTGPQYRGSKIMKNQTIFKDIAIVQAVAINISDLWDVVRYTNLLRKVC
jgi:hypothetical protein